MHTWFRDESRTSEIIEAETTATPRLHKRSSFEAEMKSVTPAHVLGFYFGTKDGSYSISLFLLVSLALEQNGTSFLQTMH